jgi:hypothetical protein
VDDPLQVYRTLIQHEDTLRNQRRVTPTKSADAEEQPQDGR